MLDSLDACSLRQERSAITFQRKTAARRAIHPPDFELDAVDYPVEIGRLGSELDGCDTGPPAGVHRARLGRIKAALHKNLARQRVVDQKLVHLGARQKHGTV